ncbi:uncharacterized protein LOC119671711 [Teleopsis dalmanni]|uniref:uncharacterized protein LOC119671711 n=1 Tax=Teleopsis dalmanni TaxID=139649 RepID=UPI0018CD5496|nr:uncharacterized protein LOC119671711 [Teleopsis dalmanni]
MSEFNSKRYYGYSMGNDNGLTTTTRNFEFQHTRAEYLDRAIQKLQKPELQKKKMFLMEKFSKLRNPDDIQNQIRDIDVDTTCSNTRVRSLSANEVDNLIEKVKSSMVVPHKESAKQKDTNVVQSPSKFPKVEEKRCNLHIKCKHRVNLENKEAMKKIGHVAISEYRYPKPKWVEIEEAIKGTAHYADLKQVESLQSTIDISDTEMDIETQENPSNDVSPSCLSPQSNSLESMRDNTALNMADCHVYDVDCNADIEVDEEIEVIDSDLEYELIQRPDYTKFCSPRPRPEDLDKQPFENLLPPQFIRIEPEIPAMGLSFLKNIAPMRYTELTDDTQPDECDEPPQMKVFIKHRNNSEEKLRVSVDDEKQVEENISEDTREVQKVKHVEEATKSKINPRTKYTKFSTNTAKPNVAPNNTAPRVQPKPTYVPQRAQTVNKQPIEAPKEQKIKPNKLKKLKKLILTRSIEELKIEKGHIFTKMTNTQERIIEMLDKLKLCLVEIYAPTGLEKHKKQKSAFEFAVRFSRNFLLPLKGMIQDLRTVTLEQLNSAVTNEATSRILGIYSLLYQALQTYSKQIRYFLMDSLPQKLLQLIDYIHTVTNICLDKGIFDPNDAIIDCLKDRCTKFATFICDLHTERFTQKHKSSKANHANYDLKMFMNDLNMYEPILVPKNVKYRPRRQMNQRKLVASHSSTSLRKQSMDPIPVPPAGPSSTEDTSILVQERYVDTIVRTGIEDVHDSNSSINLVHTLESFLTVPEKNPVNKQELSKVIMDALQTVTKDQVRQALDSILDSLGSALETKRNCDTIETIVNALHVKLDESELDNDFNEDEEMPKEIEPISSKVSVQSTSKSLKVRKHTKAQLHQKQPHEPSPYENCYDDNHMYDFDTVLGMQENIEKFDMDGVNGVDVNLRDSISFVTEESEVAEEKLYDSDGSLSTQMFLQQEQCSDLELSDTEQQQNLEKNKYNRKTKKQMFTQIRRKLSELKLEKQQLQRELQERDQQLEEYKKQAEQFKREQTATTNTLKTRQSQAQIHEKYAFKYDKSHGQLNLKKLKSPATSQTQLDNSNSKSGSSYTTNTVKPIRTKASVSTRPSTAAKQQVKRQSKLKTKKKRNIFLPPPPAPTVTPCTSARSNSDQMSMSENMMINAINSRHSPRRRSSDVKLIENMPIKYYNTKKCVSNNDIDKALDKKLSNRRKSQNVAVTKSGPIRVPFTHSFGFSQANPSNNILERFSQVRQAKYDLNGVDSSTLLPSHVDAVPVKSFMELHNNVNAVKSNSSRGSPLLASSRNSLIREEEAVEKLYINHKQPILLDDSEFNHPYKDLYNLEKFLQNNLDRNIPEYDTMCTENASEPVKLLPKLPQKRSSKNKISNIEAFSKERDAFLDLCSTNRFYKNPNFKEPWKVFTQLSEKLANEIVNTVELDFSSGVTKFVEDFLEVETQI